MLGFTYKKDIVIDSKAELEHLVSIDNHVEQKRKADFINLPVHF